MKEILSFHRYLTRKQRQLLALFILVLMPIGAWAESMTKTYTFTGSTRTEKEGGGYYTNFQSAEGITWILDNATYSNGLVFTVGYGQVAFMGATLTSVDEFYTVSKIVFDIDLSEEAIEYASARWVTFKCGQTNVMVDNTTLGMDPDEDGVVLEMTNFTPNGPLSIEIEGYGYEITLHSIKVVSERDNLGLYFYYNAGSITEWSLNWSDCVNNNAYIPPLYDYTDDDTQFPVVFTSSNENVVTIDDSGVYTLVGPGQSTVTATFDGNTKYNPESVSYTLTINDDRPPLSQCRAELDPESRKYNGARQSTVMRIYSPEGAPLVEGTDFSVSQSDNMVNAGNYTITATALPHCSYGGQLTATYTITPVSLDNAVITLSPTSLVYDGTAKEPAVSVAFMNQKTNELETPLTAGTDYTVSYSNNTNVTDEATVTVTGKDNYTGTKTATFSITKATPTVTAPVAKTGLTYTGQTQALITAGQTSGGTMQYSTDGTNYSTTIPTGTAAQGYTIYYKVVGGSNYNDVAATSLKVTISPNSVSSDDINVTLVQSEFTYTGSSITVQIDKVTIHDGYRGVVTLGPDDYQIVSYTNNINAGTASMGMKLIGNYTSNNKYVKFTIKPKNLTNDMVTLSSSTYTYTGNEIKPSVTVKDGETVLIKKYTYELTYSNNIDAMTVDETEEGVYPTVTVTGINNYTGSVTKTFSISKASSTVSFPQTAYNVEVGTSFQAPTVTTSPEGIAVIYTSSKPTVATVNEGTGAITPLGAGETVITATFAGNNNYLNSSASYTLTVIDNCIKYNLWIGETRVTERNKTDILNDGSADQGKAASFQYIPSLNKLFITNNTDNLTIKTTNDEGLTIYLAPNSTNDVGNIIYTGNNSAPLTITTDGNYPGTISLSANSSVISGFSSLALEQNLIIMSPENTPYDTSNRILDTSHATIGAPLAPITEEKTIVPKGDELQPESGNDINKVVDDILYTLGNANDSNGDGYDDGGFIVINSVTTDHQTVRVTQDYTPGTNEYLEGFKGLTFMIPAGKGKIAFNVQTLNGYAMKVMVGDAAPVTVESAEKGTVEIPYNVAEPTYVYVYNAGMVGGANSARSVQKGKMTTVHIKIYGTTVKPSKVKSANSAAEASGGEYQGEIIGLEGQDIETDEEIEASKGDINGDETINAADVAEMVNAIMGNHSTMFDKRAADPNGDGVINTADIVIIVNKIINP